MKSSLVFTYCVSTLLLVSCGQKANNGKEVSLSQGHLVSANSSPVTSLANTTSAEDRMLLILNPNTILSSENIDELISAHSQKKINTFEFRSLFWQNLSSETLSLMSESLAKDTALSKLDQLMINSIANNSVSINQIVDEIKNDEEAILPTSLQLAIIKELSRIYSRDFDKLNSLPLNENLGLLLSYKGAEEKEKLLNQIKVQLESLYFKTILSQKRLVSAQNRVMPSNQEVSGKFNLSYSLQLGRCDPASGNISFESLNQNFGRYCHYDGGGTDTNSDLSLVSEVISFDKFKKYDFLVRTYARGGYQKSRKENETSRVNYNLNGTIVIPQCGNSSFCQQIVQVQLAETNQYYNDATTTNAGISVTINGTPFSLNAGNSITIDVSQKEAVINIAMSTSKYHLGACCFNGPEQQRLSLMINSAPAVAQSLMFFGMPQFPFFAPLTGGGLGGFFDTEDDLWRHVLNSPSTPNEYRRLLYVRLNQLQQNLDKQMTSGGNPILVTAIKGEMQRLSDKFGRGLVLPVVNSKFNSLFQAKVLQSQTKVNEIVQLILLKTINNQINTTELNETLSAKEKELNNESVAVIQKFIETVKTQNNDMSEVLKNISILRTELEFASLLINQELEVLNLEKAQFENLNEK